MSGEVAAAIIGGVAGLVTGAAGSLAAPWANWQVERRRARDEQRRALLKWWRDGATETLGELNAAVRNIAVERQALMDAAWYQSLRGYLTEPVRSRWERPMKGSSPPDLRRQQTTIHIELESPVRHPLRDEVFEQIDGVEERWKLR
jgi:hypothetical protein